VIRKAALPINKPCPDCGQVRVLACSQCRGSRTGHLEGIETGPDGVVTAGHFVEDPPG
jgi:hypothetical protein